MEKIITVSLGILFFFIILRKINQYLQKKEQIQHEEQLQKFIRNRSAFFASERQKVMKHYREKVISGEMDIFSALKDTAKLLAFNSGGEDSWKQEFSAFKKEIIPTGGTGRNFSFFRF